MDKITKKYQIILADPPWSYNDKGCNGNCENHYKTMTPENKINAIKELINQDPKTYKELLTAFIKISLILES